MAVNTTKITSGPYVGNGIADTFSYEFRVANKNQLSVFETDDQGVKTELTVDTDYTVNDVGEDTGGTINRLAGALPTGYTWYIRSNYQATQDTSFRSQGAFFPKLHENAMDKLTFLIQQIQESLFNRTLKVSDSYSGDLPLTLDDPEGGKVLRWKTDGSGIENFDTEAQYVNVTGDTMVAPLSGPVSTSPTEYMPQSQVVQVLDDRIGSAPQFDPEQFIDYGLVTESVGDLFDYGSVA